MPSKKSSRKTCKSPGTLVFIDGYNVGNSYYKYNKLQNEEKKKELDGKSSRWYFATIKLYL
jgi:hypothetical protein